MSKRILTTLIKLTLVFLIILTVGIAYSNVETSARRHPARGTDSQPDVELTAKQKPSPRPSRRSLPRAKDGRAVQQTSIKGLSETTRQIMQREEATRRAAPSSNPPEPERELTYPDRRVLPQNPDSPDTPPPSSALYAGAPFAPDAQAAFGAQVTGTNFTAATHHGVHPTHAYPPDSMGAVGPAQYVLAVNGRIVTFDKNTGAADNVLDTTTNNFFQSVRDGAGTTDPRIRYDRLTSRWFLVMINTSLPNRILLAVSDEANAGVITDNTVWAKTYLTVPPAQSGNCFADFPTLGIDANALYIGTNTFCPGFISMDGYVVRKATTLDIGPVLYFTFTELSLIYPNADGSTTFTPGPFTPQGVDNFDHAATEGYFIGVDNASKGKLMLLQVNDPGGTPSISGNIPITVNATSDPLTVPHRGNALGNELGSPGRLSAVGDRLTGAVIRNGRLWTSHNIAVTNNGVVGGTPTRDGARWYEIQNLNATPSVAQWGTVFTRSDQNSTNQRYYWIPSIMVSGQGHAVIGFSTAGSSERINAAFAGRLAGDAPGTMRTPVLYTNSTTAYNPEGDGHDDPERPIRRWGDYSYTSLDPLDDMTMWTVQEFCNATDSYGVRVVKLIAPPPAAPASASPAQVPLGLASVNVTINGASGDGSGFYDPGVDLPAPALPFTHIDAGVTGGVVVNSVTYNSPTSLTLNLDTTGATSGAQSVTVINPDGQSATGTGILFAGQPTPPPTPLAPPSNLSAEAEPHEHAAIRLNWTDNSTGEDGFIVERRVENCAEFEEIARVEANTETYLDILDLLRGTRYEYQVRAFVTGGVTSEPSNKDSTTTIDNPLNSTQTRLVSRSALGDMSGDGGSNSPAMTPDGRFVAFVSRAKNLHDNDKTMKSDIYVRDMATGVTELISVNSAGEHSNGISNSPAISADGRYVVFVSTATNLGGNDLSRPGRDVFVRDREECKTRLVSVNAQGEAGNGDSFAPVISANGSAIAFVSNAKNLDERDGEKKADVYVNFTSTGVAELVSFNRDCNSSSDGVSKDPLLNDDGTLLAFVSTATNLDEAGKDIFSNQDIFLRDLTQRCTDNINNNHVELVSVNEQGLHSSNGDSTSPAMSANGRRIAFVSTGSDLGFERDVKPDVFMRDTNTNTTTLVSVNKDGSGSGNGASNNPVISGDGHFVAFVSTATNLTDRDKESKKDIFLRSLDDAATELISIANTNKSANGISNSPVISYDGRFVAFVSTGTNLLTNLRDTNSAADVFLRDRLDQTTEPISVSVRNDLQSSQPRTANGISNSPLISQGGDFVVFVSTGKVTNNDDNHMSDIFRRQSLQKTNSLDASNPTIQFSEPVYSVAESAQSVAITVTRDAAFDNTPMSVNYATGGGTASPAADYLAASGTLTFSGSETSKTFTVPILNDASDERDEVLNLTLSNPSGGASLGSPLTATLTIEDDDAPPKVSVADVTLTEPTSDTTPAAFTVKLSAPSGQPITIDYETADGTAHDGGDYQHASGTLTFTPNETVKEVRVNVNSDALAEGNETFFLNLSNAPLAIISDGQGICTITTSGVLISEFRFRGATPADPDAGDGSLDEFIEIYNATGAPLTVAAADDSAGWALAALNADGETATTLAVIPNNTVIPARGHYLVVNKDVVNNTGGRYSLSGYATGDKFYTQDISDSSGIALFATANAGSFNPGTRLDAVGFDSLSGDFANLFREGSGLPSVGTSDGEYSFVRSLNTGVPQDTNNNEQDFIFVSTDGERYGGVPSILGAPGPEGMSSEVQHNGTIKASLVDWLAASTAPPNRVRDGQVISEYARFGTLALRRMFTNTTPNSVSRLRFRVVDITTYGSPNVCGGCLQADVRVLNGRTTFNVTRSNGTQALVYGTTAEDVSAPEAGFGGGFNRSLSVGTITLDRSLAPGASIAVEFLLGVESAGFFRFFVNVEAQQNINENSRQRKQLYNGKRR